MNVDGYKPLIINDLRGAQPELAIGKMDPSRAAYVRNFITVIEGVKPRDGYRKLLNTAGVVREFHHWTAEGVINPDRLVLFKDDLHLYIHYNLLNTDQDLIAMPGGTTNVGITELEKRIYATPRSGNNPNGGVFIIDPADSAIDRAFMPPIAATITFADAGDGNSTPGEHLFALLVTSRSGFRGRLSPVVGTAFTPASYTVVGGTAPGKKIQVTVATGPIPDIALIELCVTTVDNPFKFVLVPEQSAGFSPAGSTFTFTFDIADDILTSLIDTDVDVTDFQSWITRDPGSNTDPIGVINTIAYGDRMVYNTGMTLYISEPGAPQQITADQHVQRLVNGKFCTGGFSIRGGLYLGSISTVEALTDSRNAVPAAWVPAAVVGGSVGIPAQNCIAVTIGSNSGAAYALIANPSGLWYFDGNFSQKPISWRQEGNWKRINWEAVSRIKIVDDTVNRMIMVQAPIGTATEANMLMVFDYSRSKNEFGMIPSSMDYYEFDLGFQNITSCGMYQDHVTNRLGFALCKDAGDGSTDIMFSDVSLATDDGNPINCVWENGGVLDRIHASIRKNRFGGVQVKAGGTGILRVMVTSQGDKREYQFVDDIVLDGDPELDWVSGMKVNGQNAILRFEYATNGGFMLLQMAVIYYRPISNTPGRNS